VVWVVFNILIALMLMELEVFQAIAGVLGLYSNIAIGWISAVVADLVVNKPLGLSPKGIEFRRARLFDINPVGVGAMLLASGLGIAAHLGAFGAAAEAYSAVIAMAVAFAAAPLIAWATKGRYYLVPEPAQHGAYLGARLHRRCTICEREYEPEDMTGCPAYGGPICSLCCALDARCHDLCKPPQARASLQVAALLQRLTPRRWWPQLDTGLARWLGLMALVAPGLAGLLALLYTAELRQLGDAAPALAPALQATFVKTWAALLLLAALIAWWLVLAQTSRRVAQEESNRQTEALVREIESHRRTDAELQRARVAAEAARAAADAASQAKTRYVSAISHELRTPLNSILGYAQLLDEDPATPAHQRAAVGVIRRGGEHLLGVIESTLDIARIEAGRLALEPRPVRLRELLVQTAQMFELQAAAKGLRFVAELGELPALVRADERRLTQILINVLGNAVKFTTRGEVRFTARWARETAWFEVADSGPGIAPDELERVFEPFSRGASAAGAPGGTGLGLTIARMLTALMGGEMTVTSRTAAQAVQDGGARAGSGTTFRIRLFLPELDAALAPVAPPARGGYAGERRRVLVVDNEEVDRLLLADRLQALGFEVLQAASGHAVLALLHEMTVDAILLDLAMPGIDGWATLRAVREQGLSMAPVAIVSANAFDKGLDNGLGITAADFVTKPVRFDELLDWLGARLALHWLPPAAPLRPAPPPTAAPAPTGCVPPRERLQALREMVVLGYPRGVQRLLDQIEAEYPACRPWLAPLREHAAAFRFDRLSTLIDDALARAATA
jgi:signal transduction histidine kinase/DNA-binding NarL/FixJ family response regulator